MMSEHHEQIPAKCRISLQTIAKVPLIEGQRDFLYKTLEIC